MSNGTFFNSFFVMYRPRYRAPRPTAEYRAGFGGWRQNTTVFHLPDMLQAIHMHLHIQGPYEIVAIMVPLTGPTVGRAFSLEQPHDSHRDVRDETESKSTGIKIPNARSNATASARLPSFTTGLRKSILDP